MADIKTHTIWYSENRKIYKNLCDKIEFILKELLRIEKINIHSITSRAKDLESFEQKIKNPKYDNPQDQITDLAGIRIVCYVESDLKHICEIIETNFKIDPQNSGNKSDLLGEDKVGYRSIHYICELQNNRICLPEYQQFKSLKFEIQIRTILQHAWAEIEHDRSYKFSGKLPQEISRSFRLLAGNLEMIDKGFDDIATAIDKISAEVIKGTETGNLEFDINGTTLKNYLNIKFKISISSSFIKPDFGTNDNGREDILDELQNFGLITIDDLDKIIPKDFETMAKKLSPRTNFIGALRTILIISDYEKYFDNCFKNRWSFEDLIPEEKFLYHYGVEMKNLSNYME